ncbi:Sterol regulatory element-binding protein cleavage-activating protein [Lachnellula suecica]|uniref:Sterol regulatory element-binding protein cleavage-activating protein n=1 Tax=Lachnellula suecica TaxID=602035 RepID=A0A8T9CJU5_9HELO|nr:Sterol regulatory element-binding protein cleavage-activating protein [Lachnellula suecica]
MIRPGLEGLGLWTTTSIWTHKVEDYVVALGTACIVLAGKVAANPASMIWYLLYFFRGTTEPPDLDAKHPLRHAFTRHGNNAARHPVITLLISVATAVILIYPIPFLYTNTFTNGASNLPHHVWTSASPYEGDASTRADVVMRSIWVHGSYMKALKPDVLQSALQIQDELLGPTLNFNPRKASGQLPQTELQSDLTPDIRDQYHAINGLSNASWFFHSPLQYWSCSSENISQDKDIISTVNENSRQATSVNVTLRHSIVFSGKRFEDHRLVAADALVITLVHMLDSPVGRQWERKAEEIANRSSSKWRLISASGRSLASTLYEFRFQPLSFQDDLFLGVAYALTCVYFIFSLSKLRALKSRLGLVVAVIAQIGVSILSSFTICAVLKIDLSKIPREVYPLVILTVGLENIFRLINAVITTQPENSTTTRMGEALGQTGHVAFAGVSQNLAILWMLSKVVSPQISAFCTFAAIALALDFFYLLTFFTAVLSIDVRRTELGESLGRASTQNIRHSSPGPQQRKRWMDSVLRGEAPVSTRIAGTVVMIGFVLAAQWHFFENESYWHTLLRLSRFLGSEPYEPQANSSALLSIDINQARSPTSWLRMQDHETAHEVIKVIKPHANSYIARVYDPLIFLLNGSDRTPTAFGVRPFLPAAYDFIRHQFGTFAIVVLFTVAAVSLLMNYLLWNEFPEGEEDERPDDQPLLSIKTLSRGHALDVALLSASNDGVIASVGLDRWIRVWDIREGAFSYVVRDPLSEINPFPVLAMTIDADSNWLALLSSQDRVLLWNIPERRWGPIKEVEIKGRKPAAFFFGYDPSELINPVIVVRHNGLMTELHMEAGESKSLRICRSPLVCAQPHLEKPVSQYSQLPPRIVTSSKRGCIHIGSLLDEGWTSDGIEIPEPEDDREVLSVLPLPALSSFLAVRNHTIDLIDISTHKVTHTFATKPMEAGSLRCFHSTRRRPQCGSVGLASLALAYTCAATGALILQSYLPQREGDTICFRDPWTPGSKTCCLWRETVENQFVVKSPGVWEALQVGYIVGVRKLDTPSQAKEAVVNHLQPSTGLRRRGVNLSRSFAGDSRQPNRDEEDAWEAWSLSARGERSEVPLCDDTKHEGYLLVSSLGPMVKVGKRSIAVGFGNVIKVITVGSDKFDSAEEDNDDAAFVGMAPSRKKKSSFSSRKRAPAMSPSISSG